MPDSIDTNSGTWREIERLVKERIETNRNLLEAHLLQACETEYARGKIAAFREILKLPAAKPSLTAKQ